MKYRRLYIHYFFDTMVTIGMWLIDSQLYSGSEQKCAGKWLSKMVSLAYCFGGPLAILAIEAGWWLAEVGRQPWILRGS